MINIELDLYSIEMHPTLDNCYMDYVPLKRTNMFTIFSILFFLFLCYCATGLTVVLPIESPIGTNHRGKNTFLFRFNPQDQRYKLSTATVTVPSKPARTAPSPFRTQFSFHKTALD